MRDYMVCWRGDLDNGFQEDFFVAGSNPIYTYNLVRADNMYDAVDIFLENTLDYAYNDDPVFLDDVKEQVIEEFVYLICDEDEPNQIILYLKDLILLLKRFSTNILRNVRKGLLLVKRLRVRWIPSVGML